MFSVVSTRRKYCMLYDGSHAVVEVNLSLLAPFVNSRKLPWKRNVFSPYFHQPVSDYEHSNYLVLVNLRTASCLTHGSAQMQTIDTECRGDSAIRHGTGSTSQPTVLLICTQYT
jgi:cobalamin biosynthesis protein CbiG